MTTHPEDAMKRERALEEAWRKRCNDPTLRNDRASFLIFQAGFDAALASAQHEPAPSADAEGVPTKDDARRSLTLLRKHLSNATPGTMEHEDYLSRISFLEQMLQLPDDPTSARTASIELLARHTFERMGCIADDEKCIAILTAALRRYAGDGGVTDEMVREFRIAFHECTMHHPNPASLPDYAVRKGLAAARAKSSEKGGAR